MATHDGCGGGVVREEGEYYDKVETNMGTEIGEEEKEGKEKKKK